jgi:hypothetical protein
MANYMKALRAPFASRRMIDLPAKFWRKARRMTTCRWVLPDPIDPADVRQLAAELRVAELTAELLWRRGWREPEVAAGFLQPQLKTLSDPFSCRIWRPRWRGFSRRSIDDRES